MPGTGVELPAAGRFTFQEHPGQSAYANVVLLRPGKDPARIRQFATHELEHLYGVREPVGTQPIRDLLETDSHPHEPYPFDMHGIRVREHAQPPFYRPMERIRTVEEVSSILEIPDGTEGFRERLSSQELRIDGVEVGRSADLMWKHGNSP